MKIVLLAYGSRGDVQPVVALGRGLKSAGYDVTVTAGLDFESFVTQAGLDYAPFNANMQEIVNSEAGKEWLNGSSNPLQELLNMKRTVNSMAGNVSEQILRVTEDADVIVSGLLSFIPAELIARKFNKKHIAAQYMPINPTRVSSATPRSNAPFDESIFNQIAGYASQFALYWVFKELSDQFTEQLGMPRMSYFEYIRALNHEVPLLYGVSPHVIGNPDDWDDNIHVTGYWFYDAPSDWQPSEALVDFLAAGEKPVYIGFGSMSSKAPEETATMMIDALERTGQRGIIYSGWADLQAHDLPDSIFLLNGAPHDWLLPQMKAVIHHGGAGTTSAAFRAGVPSTVVWHMGDQPYWGNRVYELGVGAEPIPRTAMTTDKLVQAIETMVNTPQLSENAQNLQQALRAEDGIANAVEIIRGLVGQPDASLQSVSKIR